MEALVTGAGRGLGRAVATELVRRGFTVLAGVRDPTSAPAGCVPVALDLADPASVDAAVAAVAARGRPLSLLVDNAGASFDGFDAEVVRRTLAVNLYGTMQFTDGLLPHLSEGARVALVSSGLGELAGLPAHLRLVFDDPRLTRDGLRAATEGFREAVATGRHTALGWPSSAYRISKVALNAYARLLARELAPRRIAVNAVCPGWVRTDMGGPGAPRSVAEGAASILATATGAEPTTGGFFRDGRRIDW